MATDTHWFTLIVPVYKPVIQQLFTILAFRIFIAPVCFGWIFAKLHTRARINTIPFLLLHIAVLCVCFFIATILLAFFGYVNYVRAVWVAATTKAESNKIKSDHEINEKIE